MVENFRCYSQRRILSSNWWMTLSHSDMFTFLVGIQDFGVFPFDEESTFLICNANAIKVASKQIT